MIRRIRQRWHRIGILALAALMLLQSLALASPLRGGEPIQDHDVAAATGGHAPCDRSDMPAGVPGPCCEEGEEGGLPCSDPANCAADCSLLRTATLVSLLPLDAAVRLAAAPMPPLPDVGPLRRHAAPPLRPPISA